MLAFAAALFMADAPTAHAEEDVVIFSNGRFNDYRVYRSTLAEPCDWGPDYYEDPSWIGTNARPFYPQAQCQGTGNHYPYAPQVVSCGAQVNCLRFGAGAGGTGWNRSEIAIADKVPFESWHRVEFKFKFPYTIPDTRGTNDPFIVQLFHQPAVTGKPKADVVGGIRLHTAPDGTRQWLFMLRGGRYINGAWSEPISTLGVRNVVPEQWVKVEVLFYMSPRSTSYVYWRVDDAPWVFWSGQMGYWFDDVTYNRAVDMKIGVYTPPLPTDLRVYLDDIIFDRYNDGRIN